MLFRKYFRRRHKSRLISALSRDRHRHQCDDCLAAAHISLNKPSHRIRFFHICENIIEDPLLCGSQFEGKACSELFQERTFNIKRDPLLLNILLLQYNESEFQHEQFIEAESPVITSVASIQLLNICT